MFFLTLYVNLFMKNHSKKVKKTLNDNEKQEVAQEPIEMKKESYKNIMADEQVDEKGLWNVFRNKKLFIIKVHPLYFSVIPHEIQTVI